MSYLSNSPNHFLASLPAQDLERLEPHMRHIELVHGNVLYHAEEVIEQVYFPDKGIISLIVVLSSGQAVEAGMLGRNGAVGAGAVVDGAVAINQAMVQVPGSANVINTGVLRRLADESETLRRQLATYERAFFAEAQQVAACNAVHHLEERLCRWLLQSRDLTGQETLPLTQEFLATMLGVQRTSVTLVARKLQESGLLSYRRGHIELKDIPALRDSCCECYDAINSHFERLIGWRPDGGMRNTPPPRGRPGR
jgi:CRP-like cAMP-binding protein